MKKLLPVGSVVLVVLLFSVFSERGFAANECAGYSWSTYSTSPVDGGACRAMGLNSGTTVYNCSNPGAPVTLCDDYQTAGGHEMVRTCSKTCIGGGGGGLTPEQIAAIAAVLEALQKAQNHAASAADKAAATRELHASLARLEATLAGESAKASNLLAAVEASLRKVNGYLAQGQYLGTQAVEIIEKQLATAVVQRVVANVLNTATQGKSVGDPVLVASGYESFTEEDYSYTSLHDLISIRRQFRSNQTELTSSFGSSWLFNYDTNIIVGRKPHIKEREELTAELEREAQNLAELAVAELNKALDALENIEQAAANARQAADEIATIHTQISTLASQASSSAAKAQSAANTATSQAAIAGTGDASANAAKARKAAANAKSSATAAAKDNSAAATIASEASITANGAEDAALTTGDLVADIEELNDAIQIIHAERMAEAEDAAAEARLEEETYPLDPYPADESVYFGPGYLKLITEDGTPIVYEEQEDQENHYLPISDNGSYTDEIIVSDAGFTLINKHREKREFAHDGRGIYQLTAIIDTNDNTIRFARTDDKLKSITDAVGRKTTFTYNEDGYIKQIIDPEGNSHDYLYTGDLLTSYTDPMGYTYSYSYDDHGRMTGRTDPLGATHSYFHDSKSRVIKEIDKEGFEFLYEYRPEERTTLVTDRRGLVTTYIYNDANRLERTIYPDRSEISHAYDDRNNIVATRDENGIVSYFNYNDKNDLTALINGLGERTEFTYEPDFNKLSSVTDPLGNTTYLSYDNSGNLITISHPDGSSRTLSYNGFGLVQNVVDELGNTTTLGYDRYGYLAGVNYADGSVQEVSRDTVGRLSSLTDELGNTTFYTYNKLGSILSRTDPRGAETSNVYDEMQRKLREIDALGNITIHEYSRRGDHLTTTDPLANTISYEYDGEGNKLRKTYPNGTGIDYGYDARGRLVQKLTFPGNLETVYEYDAKGQKIAEQDANGNITSYSYDLAGRPTGKTDATGSTITTEYDAVGNIISVIDGNGNPINYSYDQRNRLVSQTNALGNTIGYRYDPGGNLISRQNPDGTVIDYSYDSRNRLATVFYPDGTEKSFSYDPAGRMIAMANHETSESRQYDATGNLTTTTDYYTGRIDYTYDLNGNRTSMIDPDNGEFSYSYDSKNRLVSFDDPENRTTTYKYDVMGRVVAVNYPNNTRTAREYDSDNRLQSMVTTGHRDAILSSFNYTYDKVGNKLTMNDDKGVTSYKYDDAYRLVQVDYPERGKHGYGKVKGLPKRKQKVRLPTSVSYTYDPAGNRLAKTDDFSTIEYTYNKANQLLQEGSTHYSYDQNGNRISKEDEDGISSYLYNTDNFLVEFIDPENQVTQYGYDAINRRAYKANGKRGQHITSYLYDGLEVLQEVTGNKVQKVKAFYRANGQIISLQKYSVCAKESSRYKRRPKMRQQFFSYDGLGSVAALSNYRGKLKTRYQYDAFGEVVSGDLSDNQYAFTGKRLDPESGLYHFHFRKYDPTGGVWASADPIGVIGGVNLYQYVGSNPVNLIDYLGLHFGDSRGPGEHGNIGGSDDNGANTGDADSKDGDGGGVVDSENLRDAAEGAFGPIDLESVEKGQPKSPTGGNSGAAWYTDPNHWTASSFTLSDILGPVTRRGVSFANSYLDIASEVMTTNSVLTAMKELAKFSNPHVKLGIAIVEAVSNTITTYNIYKAAKDANDRCEEN